MPLALLVVLMLAAFAVPAAVTVTLVSNAGKSEASGVVDFGTN